MLSRQYGRGLSRDRARPVDGGGAGRGRHGRTRCRRSAPADRQLGRHLAATRGHLQRVLRSSRRALRRRRGQHHRHRRRRRAGAGDAREDPHAHDARGGDRGCGERHQPDQHPRSDRRRAQSSAPDTRDPHDASRARGPAGAHQGQPAVRRQPDRARQPWRGGERVPGRRGVRGRSGAPDRRRARSARRGGGCERTRARVSHRHLAHQGERAGADAARPRACHARQPGARRRGALLLVPHAARRRAATPVRDDGRGLDDGRDGLARRADLARHAAPAVVADRHRQLVRDPRRVPLLSRARDPHRAGRAGARRPPAGGSAGARLGPGHGDRFRHPDAQLHPGGARARSLRGDRHHGDVPARHDAGAGADRGHAGAALPEGPGKRGARVAGVGAGRPGAHRHPAPAPDLRHLGASRRALALGGAAHRDRHELPVLLSPPSRRSARPTRRSTSTSPVRCPSTSWSGAARSRARC